MMNRLLAALLALALVSAPAVANDVGNSSWSETDSSNTSSPPNGAPAGILPSQVEPILRQMMGGTKRWFDHSNATATSAGTNTITLTYAVAPAAYVTGETYCFIAGGTNSGATTENVNALGAKAVQWHGAALAGGEIVSGRIACTQYDGTNMELLNSQLEVSSAALAASATTDTTNAANITSGTLPPARLAGLNQLSNALGADVALNNTTLFFTGPSIAQGGTGTWFVTGQVTLVDTVGSSDFLVKLWDGSTNVSTTKVSTSKGGGFAIVTVGGVIATPAGNLRISVQDLTSANGSILFNASGGGRDSFITAFRIA